MLTLTFLAVPTAQGQETCPCPASIGAPAGSDPLIHVDGSDGRPGLVACGHRVKRQTDGDVVASEIDIFRCGSANRLLTFGARTTCRLHAAASHLVITELVRWPFGGKWQWIDVAAWEYVVPLDPKGELVKRMVLEPPLLDSKRVFAALEGYDQCRSSRDSCDYDQVIGRVLVAALAGSKTAQSALFSMASELGLDGHGAETYVDAIKLYDKYATASGKVTKRPGT